MVGTGSKQEQIQELINEFTNQPDRIRYLCTSNFIQPHHNHVHPVGNVLHHHNHHNSSLPASSIRFDNTFNRLLKFCLNVLKREDLYDIVVVHDPDLPLIDEEIMQSVALEALRSGASCLCTSEISENLLLKLDESSIDDADENDQQRQQMTKQSFVFNRILSRMGLMQDFLDSSLYRIGSKPQAFQYSIFKIMLDNVRDKEEEEEEISNLLFNHFFFFISKCTEEELDENVDCIILAKKYADIRAKLVLNHDVKLFK